MNVLSTITLLLLMALCGPAKAQLVWYEGEVTLVTSIRLTGEVCYQPQANAVLFRMAGKWRVYQAHELERFQYTDLRAIHRFASYEILQKNGETRSIIFEELNATGPEVQLLALSVHHGAQRTTRLLKLPRARKSSWQTPEPWFVWIHGRLVAPDEFVETELDGLIATSPDVVQQWASRYARPADPMALARWLLRFHGQVAQSQSPGNPPTIAQARPF